MATDEEAHTFCCYIDGFVNAAITNIAPPSPTFLLLFPPAAAAAAATAATAATAGTAADDVVDVDDAASGGGRICGLSGLVFLDCKSDYNVTFNAERKRFPNAW